MKGFLQFITTIFPYPSSTPFDSRNSTLVFPQKPALSPSQALGFNRNAALPLGYVGQQQHYHSGNAICWFGDWQSVLITQSEVETQSLLVIFLYFNFLLSFLSLCDIFSYCSHTFQWYVCMYVWISHFWKESGDCVCLLNSVSPVI